MVAPTTLLAGVSPDSEFSGPRARRQSADARVHLSCLTLEISNVARALGSGSPAVFGSLHGVPLGDMIFSGSIKDLKIAFVPHSFPSSVRRPGNRRNDTHAPHWRRGPGPCGSELAQGGLRTHADPFEPGRRLFEDWAVKPGPRGSRTGDSTAPWMNRRPASSAPDGLLAGTSQ